MLVVLRCVVIFFFFKQKTAYEMRISDWSSDVCSFDLDAASEETRYYKVMMAEVDHVDDILHNDRLRRYVFQSLGIDDSVYSYDTVRKAMSSDKDELGRASWRERVCQYV